MTYQGRIVAGAAYERSMYISETAGKNVKMRRIELYLDKRIADGEMTIRRLTNLPVLHSSVRAITWLYIESCKFENMFQKLESVLDIEVTKLGYPRVDLFGFDVKLGITR